MRPPTVFTRISPEEYFHVQRKAVGAIALANVTVACKKTRGHGDKKIKFMSRSKEKDKMTCPELELH